MKKSILAFIGNRESPADNGNQIRHTADADKIEIAPNIVAAIFVITPGFDSQTILLKRKSTQAKAINMRCRI